MSHQGFKYSAVHTRTHAPAGYKNYGDYKPWLRDEFVFRCVYCLEREVWYPNRSASFSVDHAKPQSSYPALVCDYSNLLYACVRCNSAKQDMIVIDPTQTDFVEHLRVNEDGTIDGLTDEGRKLIEKLHLNKDPALETRKKYIGIAKLGDQLPGNALAQQLFYGSFGYPSDLPELRTLEPPRGNALKHNLKQCHIANQERLPRFY